MVVVDASTLVRSMDLADPGQPEALRALIGAHERFPVAAPLLAMWEVGQVVHRKAARAFGHDAPERQRRMDALFAGVEFDAPRAPSDVAERTGSLADRHRVSFYDAAYVELAARRGGLLLTDDEGQRAAASAALGEERAFASAAFARLLAANPLD